MKRVVLIIGIILSFQSCKTTINSNQESLNYAVVTNDIDNFWEAYDALKNTKDSVATIQSMYMDKASPEFGKFLKLKNLTAEQYVDWIGFAPNFWKTTRPLTLAVKNNKAEIDKIFKNFSKIYPEFEVPDVCFAITPIQSGGTTDKGLILIGTEIAAVNPEIVDISEITGFMKSIFENSRGDIRSLVAHELIHTQQLFKFQEGVSLNDIAIVEGSADFIGSMLLEKPTMNIAIFEYGEKHQKELWEEFKSDLETNKRYDQTDWFYNYSSDRPADLGYYLGYKISESYYNNATDKRQAIKEILEMLDADDFLKKSLYDNAPK